MADLGVVLIAIFRHAFPEGEQISIGACLVVVPNERILSCALHPKLTSKGSTVMKSFLSAVLLLFIPVVAISQTEVSSFPSANILASGVVLGTERQEYYSIRSQSLGLDLVGYVPDTITDLYRNPAFFSQNTKTFVFSELTQQSQAFSSSFPLTGNGVYTSPLTSLTSNYLYENEGTLEPKIGYVSGDWGLFARGFYSTISNGANQFEGQSSTAGPGNTQSSAQIYLSHVLALDLQGSYGFTLGPNLRAGASYTLSYNEQPYLTSNSNAQGGPSSGEYDTTMSNNLNYGAGGNTAVSNIGRFGLMWKSDEAAWDALVTVEHLVWNFSPSQGSLFSEDESSGAGSNPYYADLSTSSSFADSRAAIVSNVVSAAIRRETHPDSNSSFTLKAEFGYSKFSSSDFSNSVSSNTYTGINGIDTTQNNNSGVDLASAPPDGSSYEFSAGTGGTIRWNGALLAGAANLEYRHIAYSYQDMQSSDQITYYRYTGVQSEPDTTRAFWPSHSHDATFSVVRFVIPMGFEYEFLPHLQLRLGSYVQYVYQSQEMDAVDNGFTNGTGSVSFGPITSGLGYALNGQLQIDLLNQGDFTQPHNWNLAAAYTF
jgi:hypothetical protein